MGKVQADNFDSYQAPVKSRKRNYSIEVEDALIALKSFPQEMSEKLPNAPWVGPAPDRLLINFDFWEKLARSRVAFGKWLTFAHEFFPDAAIVEPVFNVNSSRMLGYVEPSHGGIPAGQFFNLSALTHIFGPRIYPIESFFAQYNLQDLPLWIGVEYFEPSLRKYETSALRQNLYRIPCNQVSPEMEFDILFKAVSKPTRNQLVCLHGDIWKDADVMIMFQRIVGGNRSIAFLNFDNRAGIETVPDKELTIRWRKEWHDVADAMRATIPQPFAALHFRAGKFTHHLRQDRISPCLRLVVRGMTQRTSALGINHVFVGFDVLGQGEARHHQMEVIFIYFEEMKRRKGYFSGFPDNEKASTPPSQTATGKAIIDTLIMAHAKLWVGSGARSSYSDLIKEERGILRIPSENTVEVYCESDEDWWKAVEGADLERS